MKSITRYYVWEEPIGIYAPRQLGCSEGYDTLAEAKKYAEYELKLSHGGTNVWVLKATTVYKKHKPFEQGDLVRPSLPRRKTQGIW